MKILSLFSVVANSENKASSYIQICLVWWQTRKTKPALNIQNFMFSLFSLCLVLGKFGKQEQMLYVEFMFSLFILSGYIHYVRIKAGNGVALFNF